MKIAAAAYPLDWHNRWNDYVGKLRVWVRTAAEQGAELLVFPEYGALELASLGGDETARDPARVVEAIGARLPDVDDLHASLAREFKVWISAATAPVRTPDGRLVNRARVFGPDGGRAQQDQLRPGAHEVESWQPAAGEGLTLIETGLGGIGVLIGADAEAPELGRALVDAGAAVLLVPGRSAAPQAYWRTRIAAMARALEGPAVAVHAVLVGDVDWLPAVPHSFGAAGIFGPPGVGSEDGVVAVGKPNAPGWVHAEIATDALAGSAADTQTPGRLPQVTPVRLGAAEPAGGAASGAGPASAG